MEFRPLLDLLGEELSDFGEFVAIGGPKLDMGAALSHPHSPPPGAKMFGEKREQIADVHEQVGTIVARGRLGKVRSFGRHDSAKGMTEEANDHLDDDEKREAALSAALAVAQSGLRSDVEFLLGVLEESHVYIPLSEDLPDTPEDVEVEFDGELTFRPHMILGEEEAIFAVAYSEAEFVEPLQRSLGWTTSGQDLKFICVPAEIALDLAQVTIDGETVTGLVFNPGTEAELVLRRDEVASLAQGVALPLVGYVSEIEDGALSDEHIVQGAAAPPEALVTALARVKEREAALTGVSVLTTFDPERDRDPHLTIVLSVIDKGNLNRAALAETIMDEASPHLPDPGYADIVFRDAPN